MKICIFTADEGLILLSRANPFSDTGDPTPSFNPDISALLAVT